MLLNIKVSKIVNISSESYDLYGYCCKDTFNIFNIYNTRLRMIKITIKWYCKKRI